MLLYVPNEVEPTAGWPLIIWGHGDGERGNPVSAEVNIGTGNGSTTNFTGNATNTNDQILHTSAQLQVAGVTVCTGSLGVFNCPGVVTGTYDYKDGSASAINVTFTTAPASGTISMEYIQSNSFDAGLPPILNAGDRPPKFIIAMPQISAGTGGFIATDHWDAVLTKLDAEGYNIDLNRIMWSGLSLGADGSNIICLSAAKTDEFAAFIAGATGSGSGIPGGGSARYAEAQAHGKWYIQGSADGAGFISAPSVMANANSSDTDTNPIQSTLFWGLGHSGSLWDDQIFKRKDRTDQAGTAKFDYVNDWFRKFSLDAEQQATFHVEYAEETLTTQDYRLAKIQVDALSAGAVKTALDARLTAVKSTIGPYYLIDFGNSARTTSGANNITAGTSGTTLSNLIDDSGSASVYDIAITTQTAVTPSMPADIGSLRFKGQQHGLQRNTNRDGMLIDAANTTGTLTLSSMNNSLTYTLKFYVGASNSTFTARAEAEVIIGGVSKYQYADLNNGPFDFIEFNGIAPSSGNISIGVRSRQTASTERDLYLIAMEIIPE